MFELYNYLNWILTFLMYNLIGQGLLALLLRENRGNNVIYKLMAAISWPIIQLSRIISFGIIHPAHLGFLGFFLLIVLRLGLYMFFSYHNWIPPIIAPAAG